MADAPKRVALLARPGPACDNLQSALKQAGAELVMVADPTVGDSAAVAAAAPQAVRTGGTEASPSKPAGGSGQPIEVTPGM